MVRSGIWTLLAAAIVAPHVAAAQTSGAAVQSAPVDHEEGGRATEMLHSPVPLYDFGWQDLWPRDVGPGCASPVGFGDWRFTPDAGDTDGQEHWERFANYGPIHCSAILSTADRRSDLKRARADRGFLILLGVAKQGQASWELWAVQRGVTPGSSYTLLAREVPVGADTGVVSRFTVLQRRCAAGKSAKAVAIAGSPTHYCRVDTQAELLALAREMLTLPPLGVIQLQGEAR